MDGWLDGWTGGSRIVIFNEEDICYNTYLPICLYYNSLSREISNRLLSRDTSLSCIVMVIRTGSQVLYLLLSSTRTTRWINIVLPIRKKEMPHRGPISKQLTQFFEHLPLPI